MRTAFLWTMIFGTGFVLGIFVQHRRPLGRLRDEFATRPVRADRTPGDLARLPAARRLVIVAVGQSNAANYGSDRASAGAGVLAFAGGELFLASDPLPGGDGFGGSVWTRLGARLMATGDYDAVVFAVVAKGSTRAADWAPAGAEHTRLATTLRQLSAAGLTVNSICWMQGETEGREPLASGRAYGESLASVVAVCRELAPAAKMFVARETLSAGAAANEQIRLAQGAVAGTRAGPDLDRLGPEYRGDGSHLNRRGLEAAADLWFPLVHGSPSRP